MLVSLICLLLLAIAVYFLIKSKPNLFLLELMQEVFGERKESQTDYVDQSKHERTCKSNPIEKN
ncbi:MAG: hypothetical protein H6R42_100 [Nitrospirae bacterium]|jgi:hypothetical protein|nr:hypothetical protein [Nitrospirota bacterium]MBS1232446.1 hypothetical protein [Nitrospirota bacterium]